MKTFYVEQLVQGAFNVEITAETKEEAIQKSREYVTNHCEELLREYAHELEILPSEDVIEEESCETCALYPKNGPPCFCEHLEGWRSKKEED